VSVVLGDLDAATGISPAYIQPESRSPDPVSDVSRKWLGMQVADCTPELADEFGVDYHEGALVVSVEQGSPADVKGVVPGTIIVEVNYEPILGKDDFERVAGGLQNRSRAIAFHVFDVSGNNEYVAIKPR
jgi:S1-C subfamily serine protease